MQQARTTVSPCLYRTLASALGVKSRVTSTARISSFALEVSNSVDFSLPMRRPDPAPLLEPCECQLFHDLAIKTGYHTRIFRRDAK